MGFLEDQRRWSEAPRLYPVVDPLEWAIRYNTVIIETYCVCCNGFVAVDIPVFSKEWLGFEGNICETCGTKSKSTRMIKRL